VERKREGKKAEGGEKKSRGGEKRRGAREEESE